MTVTLDVSKLVHTLEHAYDQTDAVLSGLRGLATLGAHSSGTEDPVDEATHQFCVLCTLLAERLEDAFCDVGTALMMVRELPKTPEGNRGQPRGDVVDYC